jgi:general secretion pathway protein K
MKENKHLQYCVTSLSHANTSRAINVNEKGSALIITLLLVTLLVALVVEFAYEVFIDTSAFANWSNAQKSSSIARSGQTLSSTYLANMEERSYTFDREIDLPIERDFGFESHLSVKIWDENARFNINSIISSNGLTNDKALSSLKKLLKYLNINPDLALAIADWIDPDSDPRIIGSENNAKNTFLWSLDELQFIDGMDEENIETLMPLITVYGDNRININTAPVAVLVCLHTSMTESLAQSIVDYREITPLEHVGDITNVPGLEGKGSYLIGRISVKSSKFRVISEASVSGIKRIIESVMDTSLKVHFWREV